MRKQSRGIKKQANDKVIGGLGVIENDFHDRKDLTPNICAVYTEEEYRNICRRLLGEEVPFAPLHQKKGMLQRIGNLFHK